MTILVSCVPLNNSSGEEDLEVLRHVTLAYRYGYGLSEEKLSQIAKSTSYDDEVLAYYEYFKKGIPPKVVETKRADVYDDYDERVLNHLKENLSADETSPATIVDLFDEPLPKSDWEPEMVQPSQELLERVHETLLNDWKNKGFFYTWSEKFSIPVSEEDLSDYANFLVSFCEASSRLTLRKTSQAQSSFFVDEIDLSLVPTELVLAICYVESKFFPAAFRCELDEEGTAQSVSLGLGQLLCDADSLLTDQGIGNSEEEFYTFELLNQHYFENLFQATDLVQVKANVLFCRTLLALLMKKFS